MTDSTGGTVRHRVTYISADDWAGVYVDGELRSEGHSIPHYDWMRLLERLGAEVENLGETPEAYAAIEAEGRCPTAWPPAQPGRKPEEGT